MANFQVPPHPYPHAGPPPALPRTGHAPYSNRQPYLGATGQYRGQRNAIIAQNNNLPGMRDRNDLFFERREAQREQRAGHTFELMDHVGPDQPPYDYIPFGVQEQRRDPNNGAFRMIAPKLNHVHHGRIQPDGSLEDRRPIRYVFSPIHNGFVEVRRGAAFHTFFDHADRWVTAHHAQAQAAGAAGAAMRQRVDNYLHDRHELTDRMSRRRGAREFQQQSVQMAHNNGLIP